MNQPPFRKNPSGQPQQAGTVSPEDDGGMPHRRYGLRLRPRVRPRRTAAPTDPGRQPAPDRSLRLASWGAVVSAIAAALGLLFSGSVAWFSVSATRQQLEQNRRHQAGRVTFWYTFTDTPDGGYGTVVVNRSLDPVTGLYLVFRAPKQGDWIANYESVSLGFGTLTPCTRLTFPPSSFYGDLSQSHQVPEDITPQEIRFTDADGRNWTRSDESLQPGPDDPTKDRVVDSASPELAVPNVKREPAQHCDV